MALFVESLQSTEVQRTCHEFVGRISPRRFYGRYLRGRGGRRGR
jgi:hypothetical protein